MDNVIFIGGRPSELKGVGTEYLVVDGIIVAKFYNGNFVTALPTGDSEKTKASG